MLPLALAACDADQTGPRDPERARLIVVVSVAEPPEGFAASQMVPPSVASITVAVRDGDCDAGEVVYADTADVAVEDDSISFAFDVVGLTAACFRGAAYSEPRATGTLVFEGTSPSVDLTVGGEIRVHLILALVGTTAPLAMTQAASDVTSASAVLHGFIVPGGFVTVGYFEWGTTTSYGSTTPVQPLGDGRAQVELSQLMNGLQPLQTYHYRAVAVNSGHVVHGVDVSFTTMSANGIDLDFAEVPPPTVATGAASGLTESSAIVAGMVNPQETDTYAYVEWGRDADYGQTSALISVGPGATDAPIEAMLTGLSEGAGYHYRVVAFNAGGLTLGADQVLHTTGCAAPGRFEVPGNETDDDCDGIPDNVVTCDSMIAIDAADPLDAAAAMGFCRQAADGSDWGVVSARWVMPDGSAVPDSLLTRFHTGHGVLDNLGVALPREGAAMLALSTEWARGIGDPGHGVAGKLGYVSPLPENLPDYGICPPPSAARDAAGLEIVARVPVNATALSFHVKFFTNDHPLYACTNFTDPFFVFMDPFPGDGASPGNVALDLIGNPISASSSGSVTESPLALGGTDFAEFGGASVWLPNQVAVTPGSEVTLRFVIYDASDGAILSLALIDALEWHE